MQSNGKGMPQGTDAPGDPHPGTGGAEPECLQSDSAGDNKPVNAAVISDIREKPV